MVAINWFEVLLPSMSFEIPIENVRDLDRIPTRKKTINYRTILRINEKIIYHLTFTIPDNTEIKILDFNNDPSIAAYSIEHGFAIKLNNAGFNVRLKHVGGIAFKEVNKSLIPNIYKSLEGVRFRCFYGFKQNGAFRWGLILRYVSSQKFILTLNDSKLQKFAIGKRIIQIKTPNLHETESETDIFISSGILSSISKNKGIVIGKDGHKFEIDLNKWILPCNRANLLNFIKHIEGPSSANNLATKLQQDALVLTPEGRINTNLAKDQLVSLKNLLKNNNLLDFQLLLLSKPLVRIIDNPLNIGVY